MEKAIFIFKRGINVFLEMLFPSKCIGCNKNSQIICQNCTDKLPKAERPTEESIMAVYDYRDPVVKKAVWNLKYYHMGYIGQKMGQLLYSHLLEDIADIKMFSQGLPIYVIPVPISDDKRKNRGYNQSEILARSFCKEGGVKLFELRNNIIYKKSNTIPQARLTNRNKRLQNIKGAFGIRNEREVKGKTIIIIDDVTTTGGTMLEIMKVLKKHKAKKVWGFAVAH